MKVSILCVKMVLFVHKLKEFFSPLWSPLISLTSPNLHCPWLSSAYCQCVEDELSFMVPDCSLYWKGVKLTRYIWNKVKWTKYSVIYVDMKLITPRVGWTDIHTDGQSGQGLWFQELPNATKKVGYWYILETFIANFIMYIIEYIRDTKYRKMCSGIRYHPKCV